MRLARRYAGRVARLLGPSAWSRKSYSQEGEDLAIDRLLGERKRGLYVDVGCHHPFRFSNTYLLYRKGWRGVCIDPLPGSRKMFNRWRSRDIFVEQGVSLAPSDISYFMFNEPALNTFDPEIARSRDGVNGYKIIDKRETKTDTLRSILSRNLLDNSEKIGLLSVDVEGLDLDVLKSNDWNKFRPSVIIAECLGTTIESLQSDATAQYLVSQGYSLYAKTGQSVIFVEKIIDA